MDKILGGRAATKPPLLIDTLNCNAETVGTDDDDQDSKNLVMIALKIHWRM